jgi:GH24 family phage-related lysozyme (muramidase)
MHQAVLDIWHQFSEPLEGRVHWMYCDILGLITTGVGNLIDPVGEALKLPWRYRDGSLASKITVAAEWRAVKAASNTLKKRHYHYAQDYSTVRLTDDDIDELCRKTLLSNEYELKRTFGDWDAFPADAQLGILSMSWAMGPGFPHKFPRFTSHVSKGNWADAAVACKIRSAGNPGVIPRNKANAVCFYNSACVAIDKTPIEVLHWPTVMGLAEKDLGG